MPAWLVVVIVLLVAYFAWLGWEFKHSPEGEEIPGVGFVESKPRKIKHAAR